MVTAEGSEMDEYSDRVQAAPQGHVLDLGSEIGPRFAGQTVTIRHQISYAAEARIAVAGARVEMRTRNRRERRGGSGSGVAEIVMQRMPLMRAVISECVLSWTLLDIDGQPLPCDASVAPERLDRRMDDIVTAIREHYLDPDELDDEGDGADPTPR